MIVRHNKSGTVRKGSVSHLNSDEIYYIRRHLEKGISKEHLAKRLHCDLSDIEEVNERRLRLS